MPPHAVYIEPFAGSAAVFRLKLPASLNILIELDPAALKSARLAGADRPPRRFSRYSSLDVDGAETRSPSTVAGSSDKRSPVGGVDDAPGASWDPLATSDGGVPRTLWVNGDGLDFLEHYDFRGDELVYCDPPYLRAIRRSTKRIYRCEMDDHHHSRLLAWAAASRSRIIISGYASGLYDDALKGWRRETFEMMTRHGLALEVLWSNFPPPATLHDDRYLGDDFRERERIRRRSARWVARLQGMPELERAALLRAVDTLKGAHGEQS